MTERDSFEIRLHAAVRGYARLVTSDLDPAELAHLIATSEPRRNGWAAALAVRGFAIPGRTRVLLLLVALLTALVAGMLAVGSRPREEFPAVVPPVVTAFACPPGTNPGVPGPADQARPITTEAMAFDRQAGRLVAVADAGSGVETWTFDVCTNTWTRMHPNQEPVGVAPSDQPVFDVDSGVTIVVGSDTGRVWALDLRDDTWTEKGAASAHTILWAYDPLSGLVVATDDSGDSTGMRTYDVATGLWTAIPQANGPGSAEFAYDVSIDRIVAYAFGAASVPETWLFDIRTGTWSRSGAVTPAIVAGWGLPRTITYDEAAQRTVILSSTGLAAYDAAADRWEFVLGGDIGSVPDSMVYDPVNWRLVGRGYRGYPDQGGPSHGDVVAFDLVTREWTVLLESSEGPSAPSPE